MREGFSPYSKEVIRHFKNPRNVGELKDASATGKVGNLACGDIMRLYIKVKKDKKSGKEKITDIKFQTFGCIVAIANTSLITTMVRGKTLEESLKITKNDILKKLGKLPPIKIHCSVLAVDALHDAIYNYYQKNNMEIPEELQKEHERIKHTMEEIEERHHEFVKLEEGALKK